MANPLILPLLGQFIERPGHAYELTQRLIERYPHLEIRRSSVTTLISSLAAAGLVKAQRPRRVAGRPIRRTYELTEAGYAHVREQVAADIVAARAGSTRFVLALAYIGILPAPKVADLLQQRVAALDAERQALHVEHGLPEYQMLEVAYWQTVLTAEIRWVTTLAERLQTDAIAWPRHKTPGRRA